MGWFSILFGVILAVLILSAVPKLPSGAPRSFAGLLAIVCIVLGLAFSSVRYISADRVGIVTKNALGSSLSGGRIISTSGEMGVQADVLYPGWKFWYWPVIFSVDAVPTVKIKPEEVGLVEAVDGQPLSPGQVFADEMPLDEFMRMLSDPRYFLAEGKGQKGPQATVLTPGEYRLNTELFRVKSVPQTDVKAGTVAVLKSNVGTVPSIRVERLGDFGETVFLARDGEKGIRGEPLSPGKYPINPEAYEVYTVSTERRVANYTTTERTGNSLGGIAVKSSDGFNFPVDVRVVYYIKKDDAPRVVALLGGDNQKLQELLTSRVRSIFRDNAESVSALDYINQRSRQAKTSTDILRTTMAPYGITIESIDIGEVGNEETLGELLKTQRDRKIAQEQQQTFKVQQQAAEQEKQLTATRQEATEEKRLATARYEVKIAEEEKQRQVIAANAQAEAIGVRAAAQAEAFRQIAEQIGSGNAALLELLKVIGEGNIDITPNVMVSGSAGAPSPETAALIGTMLDSMISRDNSTPPR